MNATRSRLERLIVIPAVMLLALIIPRSASIITDRIWPLFSAFDPEKIFLWLTIHHVLALVFRVLVMSFVFRMNFRQWQF